MRRSAPILRNSGTSQDKKESQKMENGFLLPILSAFKDVHICLSLTIQHVLSSESLVDLTPFACPVHS